MPTNNIDKSVYTAPLGLADIGMAEEDPLEIEIVSDDEEAGMQEDGSMIVDLEGRGEKLEDPNSDFAENLAESLDDTVLLKITSDLEFEIDNDRNGRRDWEKTYKEGLNLLGLKIEERDEPWEGACGIHHPMITEAVVRFQAETTTETFPAKGPAKSKIIGKETRAKKEAAERVETDMNNELTENMPEFRPEHERLLWELPCVGSAFKKVYYDNSLGRQVSMFVSAEDVLLPYGTSDLSSCRRITHVMRKTKDEIVRLQESGFYKTIELGDNQHEHDDVKRAKDKETGATDLNDDRFIIYESHVDLFIAEDSRREPKTLRAYPYVVTFIKNSASQVLAVRRNWKENDKYYCKRLHFVQYNYVPGFGSYGYGLFHLIGGYAKGATAILRQLVDAGTLSNLPGGLKTRGLRIKGDDTPIAPGEFRDVDVGSGTISDNIMTLPYKEPSVVLAATLDKIVEDGRRFAATADMQISDMSAQAPVGTTLAILERQLKVLTAVQARVHYSLKQELKLLKDIIRDYTPDKYTYDPATGTRSAKKADYEVVDIIPVSDPNASTLSQRVVQHQAAIQMATMAPEIYDLPVLHREMLEVLGFKNAAKIVPLPEDMKPCDPVTENMNILKSKPVKAFLYQDHMAHIATHRAAMQDPMIMQVMGQNPKAPMIMAAATAHLAEHMGYLHRQQIEARLGMTLPPEGEHLPPQVEAALSSMMAQASQQVLEQNQAIAAAQAADAAARDPLVQLQMKELAVKEKDAATKEKKVVLDAAAKADELRIREKEVDGRLEAEGVKIASTIQKDKATIAGTNLRDGIKLAIDAQKVKQDAKDKEKKDGLERDRMERDTAHKAHQTVSNENLQREKMKSDERKTEVQTKAKEAAAKKTAAAKKAPAKKASKPK
jgi:hypothetical protein